MHFVNNSDASKKHHFQIGISANLFWKSQSHLDSQAFPHVLPRLRSSDTADMASTERPFRPMKQFIDKALLPFENKLPFGKRGDKDSLIESLY